MSGIAPGIASRSSSLCEVSSVPGDRSSVIALSGVTSDLAAEPRTPAPRGTVQYRMLRQIPGGGRWRPSDAVFQWVCASRSPMDPYGRPAGHQCRERIHRGLAWPGNHEFRAEGVKAGHGPTRFALTKFRPPELPTTLVTRSGLHERLAAGSGQRLTTVVGSAGAGKSVLLANWAAARPPGVTSWLSCDRADGDPAGSGPASSRRRGPSRQSSVPMPASCSRWTGRCRLMSPRRSPTTSPGCLRAR